MWAPDYVTVEDLRDYTGIDDEASDPQLAGAIAAASRTIDAYCRRQFGVVDAVELRSYDPRTRSAVDIDDLMTAVDLVVEVDGAAVVVDRLLPRNALTEGKPWTRLQLPRDLTTWPQSVDVTAMWGWTAVPEVVRQACLLQATRVFKRKDSPFGVAGSPELGSELRLLAKADPDVAVMLAGYVRRGRVA